MARSLPLIVVVSGALAAGLWPELARPIAAAFAVAAAWLLLRVRDQADEVQRYRWLAARADAARLNAEYRASHGA